MVRHLRNSAFLLLMASPLSAQTLAVYPATTDQPFHADVKMRRVKIHPDGTQTVDESQGILARDSRGRVLNEQLRSGGPDGADGSHSSKPHAVSISDAAAMTQLRWDDVVPGSKTVLKTALRPIPQGRNPAPLDACQREKGATRSYPNGETQKIEDLGERTIQGILAHGCRVSTFIPVGAIHNAQALTVTDDSWTSYEMRLRLLSVHRDPANGEEDTMELDNIVRGEPDPTLFQPPPDYQVRDLEEEKRQKERFEIPVIHPEFFAGPWETREPNSGITDGILVSIDTEVRQSTEYLTQLQIKVYRREGDATQEGWFTANNDANTTWDGKELRLKFQPVAAGDVALDLDLDLKFDSAQQSWTGTFNRGGTAKQVRLQRPGAAVQASSGFAGDWFLHLEPSRHLPYSATCIHVAEATDGVLLVWEDSKSPRIINAPMHNEYGREYAIENVKFDSLALKLASSKWAGNQITFSGTLSPDGTKMEGRWATNGQASPDSLVFLRSSGEGFSGSPSSP